MVFIKGKAVIFELQRFFLHSTAPCGDCQHLEFNKYGIICSECGRLILWKYQNHVAGCQVKTGCWDSKARPPKDTTEKNPTNKDNRPQTSIKDDLRHDNLSTLKRAHVPNSYKS